MRGGETMKMDEFQKMFQELEKTGVFEQVSEKITEAAHISAKALKEQNATDDEFVVPLVTTVTKEAIRQSVYLSLLLSTKPDGIKFNPDDYQK
jgi:hypothetical protein